LRITSKSWTTEGSEFESRWGNEFSVVHVVQTGSGAYPASYPMGIGDISLAQNGRVMKLTIHLQLVLSSRNRGSIHPPYAFIA
jgi:hypothetical protein